jgi:hypothetical protein
MGLQVRKRTKGKNGWWNGSYSKRGVGASGTVKVSSNVTYNTGDLLGNKNSSRLTINFGNGIRYVSYGKRESTKKTTTKKQTVNHHQQSSGCLPIVLLMIGIVVVVAAIAPLLP